MFNLFQDNYAKNTAYFISILYIPCDDSFFYLLGFFFVVVDVDFGLLIVLPSLSFCGFGFAAFAILFCI
jgi:hypothetical protein